MNLRALFWVIVLGAVSAGCTTVRVIDHDGGQNYYDGAFEFATKEGKINTHVAGTPFLATADDFNNQVTTIIYGANFGKNVNYIPSPPNTDKYGYHIVIAFNVVEPVSIEDICQNAGPVKFEPGRDTTSMQGIFCQGAYPLSYASGYVSGLTGPSDPNFTTLLREVALAMIPRYDDYKSGDFSPD